jgi:hypothetical protein
VVGSVLGLLGAGVWAVNRWFRKMARRIHATATEAGQQPR